MVNYTSLILGMIFIICSLVFVFYLRWKTKDIDWGKSKQIKDPMKKFKGIR